MDCLSLTKKLISFPSVTPLSSGCIEYIAELLKSLDFETHVVRFGEDRQQVTNLYAVRRGLGPNICFAGHIDVVPPGPLDQWKYPPFDATIEDDKLYGRGAVDMKAAIAAMIISARDFLLTEQSKDLTVSFLITSDEEGAAQYGIKPMINWLEQHNHKIDFCILGEPTYKQKFGDVIQVGRRGSASFKLVINGLQGHVAYDNFVNPNDIAAKVAIALKEMELDEGNGIFAPSRLNITSIDASNVTTNLIPNSAVVRFNIRYNTLHTALTLEQKCRTVISSIANDFELRLVEESPVPFITDLDNVYLKLFQKIVADCTQETPELTTYGGASDGRFIIKLCPVIEFGLGSSSAHQINEYLFLEDLQKLCGIYHNFLLQSLGAGFNSI
jgi:succinyl-diaminopimelate desuccinylase